MAHSVNNMNILEVNNFDIYGSRFNGYDRISTINRTTSHTINQIVTHKISDNKNVYKFYQNWKIDKLQNNLHQFENEVLSVQSQFSIIGELLLNNEIFKSSDLIHYHMIHNTKIPLPILTHLFRIKPTVMTIHDLWNITGRCVHPFGCDRWETGCQKCDCLDTLFQFKLDNCKYLWRQKEKLAKEWDIDIIVSTKYIDEVYIKQSPIMKDFRNVHILPFGVDLDLFKDNLNKYEIRRQLNIPSDDIVIFLRSQKEFKCAKEINSAFKLLRTDRSITLITCDEVGNFNGLKGKYNIIELGMIQTKSIIEAYNACDFFIMATKGETFGIMAIEAMACSRAVIVFDNMTLPQITFTPDCGVLVENLNVEKLVEAIKHLIDNDEERIKRGILGREIAEKHYDVSNFNKNIIRIYENAFERQKYKLDNKSVILDMDYDKNNINIKKLAYTIDKYYKILFNNKIINFNFNSLEQYDNSVYTNIDYADDEVLKFINYFNHIIYLNYKSHCYQAYNGYRLKEVVKWKMATKPEIYRFLKLLYSFFKLIKNKL